MKIISRDNFDREGPAGDECIVAENVPSFYANHIAFALNEKFSGETASCFFAVVKDDHKLKKFEP